MRINDPATQHICQTLFGFEKVLLPVATPNFFKSDPDYAVVITVWVLFDSPCFYFLRYITGELADLNPLFPEEKYLSPHLTVHHSEAHGQVRRAWVYC